MTATGEPVVVVAHAPLSPPAGHRVWRLLGACVHLTEQVLAVVDVPAGQHWTVLLNGSSVQWTQRTQRTVRSGDQVLAFEQDSGDLAELAGEWTVADGRLSLTIRFQLGVDGLAPLLNPIWAQAFQAFADEIVRSVAAAAAASLTEVGA